MPEFASAIADMKNSVEVRVVLCLELEPLLDCVPLVCWGLEYYVAI